MVKLNNYYVGQKFRDVTKTNGVDTPVHESCLPVICINPTDAAVEVQPSLPKPNVKQTVHYTTVHVGGTLTQMQVATVDSTKKIYFLGYSSLSAAATPGSLYIYDATSGSQPSPTANTAVNDASGFLDVTAWSAANTAYSKYSPIPIQVTNGIRVNGGGASQDAYVIIVWIEELV